jgi:hypothetical protein
MKTLKLLQKVEEILDAKKSKQREQKKSLKEVLGKLKKRKHKLEDKLKTAGKASEKDRIRKDLAVIRVQRHKGLKTLKNLK